MARTRRVEITVILFIALVSWACGNRPADSYPIGVVLPLSGNAANYGKACKQAMDLAEKEINGRGGILGRPIGLHYEDDKAQAKDGVGATQKLVDVDHVQVIIGGIVSAVTLAAAPICESRHVVWLSPTSSAPAITRAGDYIFRNFPSDDIEGRVMADFIRSKSVRSVMIFQVQNEYGEGISKVFANRFVERGGSIAGIEKYAQDNSDFRSMLAKAQNLRPDAVYCVGYYTDVALLIKQAREFRFQVPFFSTTTIEDPQFVKIGGAAVDGVVYPLASGYRSDSAAEPVRAFRAAFKAAYGDDPGFVSAQCYDCMYLVKQAAENGKGLSGAALQRGMAGIKGFNGVSGETSFDENGDVLKPIEMKRVENGQFVKYH